MSTLVIKIIRTSLVLILLIAFGVGVFIYYAEQDRKASLAQLSKQSSGIVFTSPHQTETEWLISEIAGNLAINMVRLVEQDKDSLSLLSVEVSCTGKESSLRCEISTTFNGATETATDYIDFSEQSGVWTPASYDDYLSSLASVLGIEKRGQEKRSLEKKLDETLLQKALSFGMLELLEYNRTLTSLLEERPQNSNLLERAAFLICLFCLQESSGDYADFRRQLNKITAYLAQADFFSTTNERGRLREYIEVLRTYFSGSQAQAKKLLDQIVTVEGVSNGVFQAWNDALYARITDDWRPLSKKHEKTPLEVLELLRAVSDSISSDRAVSLLSNQSQSLSLVDVSQKLTGYWMSVGNSHQFVKGGLQFYHEFVDEVYSEYFPDYKNLDQFLNSGKESEPTIMVGDKRNQDVLGSRLWADFFQRHLVKRFYNEYHFYKHSLGLEERSEKFVKESVRQLGDLYLTKFMLCWRKELRLTYAKESMDNLLEHPYLFNMYEWRWFSSSSGSGKDLKLSDLDRWYSPALPPGSSYDLVERSRSLRELYFYRPQKIEAWMQERPYDWELREEYIRNIWDGIPQSSGDFLEIVGPSLDYKTEPMIELSKLYPSDSPDKKIDIYRKIAELLPNYNFILGQYLIEQNMIEEAVAEYEKGVAVVPDKITIAYYSGWLVNYYLNNGKTAAARKLADVAASSYSATGLKVKAELEEKLGNYQEAEKYYEKIAKRYREPGDLAGFYYRMQEEAEEYKEKFQKQLEGIFPEGMVSVSLTSFSNAPASGVAFLAATDSMRRYGLTKKHIIVAIDGYKVDTVEQYTFVRSLRQEEKMELILWDGSKHVLVHPVLSNRLFGVGIETYSFP